MKIRPLSRRGRFFPPAAAMFVLPLVLLAGCPQRPEIDLPEQDATDGQEQFDLAMEYFNRLGYVDETTRRDRVVMHLNQWTKGETDDGDWRRDPLIDTVPSRYLEPPPLASLQRLKEMRFSDADFEYLQEVFWLHGVATWSSRRPLDSLFSNMLHQTAAADKLSVSEADELTKAVRMFDWTVRSLQLDPLAPYPAEAVVGTASQPAEGADGDAAPAPSRGEIGPGYLYYPRQVMLYGHADAWQRSRVFMLLCRQQRIDAVMLALEDGGPAKRHTPWAVAVLIGRRAYLFDTSISLPLRDGEGGIATLADVRQDPTILSSHAVSDGDKRHDYPVREVDLERVIALVDASPEALSLRMNRLESQLASDQRMILSVDPSHLAGRVKEIGGAGKTVLWSLPMETVLFRSFMDQLQIALSNDESGRVARQFPAPATMLYLEVNMFDPSRPLVAARRQHFLGAFDATSSEVGAKRRYLESRVPEEIIDRIPTSTEIQQQLDLTGLLPDDPQRRQEALAQAQSLARTAKAHADFWLALAHYDSGNLDAAIDWLERIRNRPQETSFRPFLPGCRYNLARSYESKEDIEKARTIYLEEDPSSQRHGNLLRARWLKDSEK